MNAPSLIYATVPQSLPIIIRALLERDLHGLEWQGGEDLRGFYHDMFHAHQAAEIHVLVADFNDFPIGLANIHWPGKPTQPGIPDIQSLRVHPIFRGLKIGSHLLSTCEKLIAERDHGKVGLSVALDNSKAEKLYKRHGYQRDGLPYCDVWYYNDARGQAVRVEEDVMDLVKHLSEPEA